jgi:hypothetical protein
MVGELNGEDGFLDLYLKKTFPKNLQQLEITLAQV